MACEAFAIAAVICVVWALWERNKRHHVARLHLAASARLYEREQHLRAERRRVDSLLMRLAREQGRSEQVAQTALEVATLAQLDALWPDVSKVDACRPPMI